jgi:Domain of unknown function (DUF1843)
MSDQSNAGSDNRWPPIVLYAAAMQQARQSGDRQKMQELAERARREGSNDPEIQSALRELEAELGGTGGSGGRNEPRMLYAEAMQQARVSGDVQKMRELAQRARTEGAGDPEIQAALAELEAEIGRRGGG